jgi:probable HAF family extracellular repeat protein
VLIVVAALVSAAVPAGFAAADRSGYVMRDLGTFGGTGSLAYGINDSGRVVIVRGAGASMAAQIASSRSLVWRNGRVRWLGTLAGKATIAAAINERGQVAGVSRARGLTHAFLWQNGRMRDLGAIGGELTEDRALALNDKGEVAGTRVLRGGVASRSGTPRAFLWRGGKLLDLGTLGGEFVASAAYGINARGQVVGISTGAGEGVAHPFLWQNGSMRDIASPSDGVQLLWAWAINDRGQVAALGGRVAGDEVNERTLRAYLWQDGTITNLGVLRGFARSTPTAINDRGQVVGFAIAANGARRAFLWQNGRMTDLGGNANGSTFAMGINERDQIVGAAIIDGNPHAVLWTKRG